MQKGVQMDRVVIIVVVVVIGSFILAPVKRSRKVKGYLG